MPKFTLILDSSQLAEIQTCPLKWYYKYKLNLQLAGLKTTAPDKGTLIHWMCDDYYTQLWKGINPTKAANETIQKFIDTKQTEKLFLDDKKHELEKFLWSRFHLYTQRYFSNDFNLPLSSVSPAELGFSKVLYEDDRVLFIVEGRIDLVCILLGTEFCFVDHKTQDRESTLYQFKPQFKTYAWATGYRRGIVNYIGLQEDKNGDKSKAGTLFRRDLIYFPEWMIAEWEKKMIAIFFSIYNMMQDPDIAEELLYQVRNDTACGGAFDSNPCQFCYICEEGNWDLKKVIKEMKYNTIKPWAPWSLKEETK